MEKNGMNKVYFRSPGPEIRYGNHIKYIIKSSFLVSSFSLSLATLNFWAESIAYWFELLMQSWLSVVSVHLIAQVEQCSKWKTIYQLCDFSMLSTSRNLTQPFVYVFNKCVWMYECADLSICHLCIYIYLRKNRERWKEREAALCWVPLQMLELEQ